MKRNNGMVQLQRGETPRHNPKLGFFGFAGLLGFLGIFTYQVNQTVFPFFFFWILRILLCGEDRLRVQG